MVEQISNCYDSHTHFLATGQIASGLQLHSLQSAEEVGALPLKPTFFRGDWLTGFGWDQNKWLAKDFPKLETLDHFFPDRPVLFSRIDGHASWINTLAMKELQKKGLHVSKGILIEQEHIKALSLLPDFTEIQIKQFLIESQKIFNRAGFTHVRDLSMDLKTWNSLVRLYEEKSLTVCLESFITTEGLSKLDGTLNLVKQMKNNTCPQLRMMGVKFFVDGSLGSKTAYLSENYLNSNDSGRLMWTRDELVEAFAQVWTAGHDIAVHCIGDECAHLVVRAAREVSAQGILGRLHLEHVEILRPETVQMMKPLHVTCYMQPCHWTSDHAWLPQVLSVSLQKNIFQWELLRKNKIPFFFGSDSPIEKPSIFENKKALLASAKSGVPALQGDWKIYHSHPDKKWTRSWTEFDQENISQVFFNEVPLL